MPYDKECPICGTVNHDLNLDETEGWMICEHCHMETQDPRFRKYGLVPVLSMEAVVRRAKAEREGLV